MKYLKKYKIFESNSIDDIISDVKDMLLEIEDCGGINTNCREFKIFNYKTKTDDSEIRVWIRPIESDDEDVYVQFEISDVVIDVFRRIIDYMKSQGWSEYGVVHDDGVEVLPINLDNMNRMYLLDEESFGIWFRLPEESGVSDKDIPGGWVKINNKLVREFKFTHPEDVQSFLRDVESISNSQNHHPGIKCRDNVVILTLSTHDAGDIVTKKDIRLALSINGII